VVAVQANHCPVPDGVALGLAGLTHSSSISHLPSSSSLPVAGFDIVDLASLWNLTLENNPNLREAAARLEMARGKHIQAARYPNPQVAYEEEDLGTGGAPAGRCQAASTAAAANSARTERPSSSSST